MKAFLSISRFCYCYPDSTNGKKETISGIDDSYYVYCIATAVMGKQMYELSFSDFSY